MQNNSLIRVFGILFALVSIYQLSFTFITSNVEKQADTYAMQTVSDDVLNYLEVRDQKANSYLDSIGNNSLYGFTSYNDAKDKELNKAAAKSKGGSITKNRKGGNDYRKGGYVLSTVDNRKKSMS